MISNNKLSDYRLWFVTGSQHLYGPETLEKVKLNAGQIVKHLNECGKIPVPITDKSIVTTPDEIYQVCQDANQDKTCVGIICWMHTFSPAKMWINGIGILNKPFVHLHTQFNTDIPWGTIDMDFMNLNQSAHGDREFGFMITRMRKSRKVVVGHWKDESVIQSINQWSRVASGWHALRNLKVARFGDNMREVSVTEGDKVEAQLKFGFSVNGFGLGDLVRYVDDVSESEIASLLENYRSSYEITKEVFSGKSLKEAAAIEIGLERFLSEGGFGAFTTTFENLHGLAQLPGISAQRLMQKGFGFGAEGDWKTAAILYAIKVMDQGLDGGSSFMEDYTYHFDQSNSLVMGAHMLEICPSIAMDQIKCEVHPLDIGGKNDPARLVFDVDSGKAVNVSLIDMGNRFRFLVNEVEVVKPQNHLPHLPVARAIWKPQPNFNQAAEAWILAGGAHHTVFSKAINTGYIEDLAEIAGVEIVVIDENTTIRDLKQDLRVNEVYYGR